jgi:thioredoxin 1
MSLQITDASFDELLESGQPLVVDFWAEWCGPCRLVAPIMDELAETYKGRAVVGNMDVEENNDTVERYSIRNVPTVLFFKNGEEVDKLVGSVPKDKFVEKMEALLSR